MLAVLVVAEKPVTDVKEYGLRMLVKVSEKDVPAAMAEAMLVTVKICPESEQTTLEVVLL